MTRTRDSVPPGEASVGVIYDVDGVLRLATVRRQLRRVRAMLARSTHDRRSVQGMSRVLRALVADRPDTAVFYLTALPIDLAGPVMRLLRRDGYPSGALLMSGRGLVARWLVGGLEHQRATIDVLADRMPERRWVLEDANVSSSSG
jgi:phosphatidate phosphatase APP1